MSGKVLRIKAPAKLNLFLAVGPRRLDGFHEVETVTVQLELSDQLELQVGDDITETSFSLTCEPVNLCPDPIPQDERNLVVRAVKRLAQESGISIATAIHLVKHIPSQAGLGGGSSDAAATLTACNELWDLGLGTERLGLIGGSLGSDIPLFLGPTYSLCSGRGEMISPLFGTTGTGGPQLHFVLFKPPIGLNTGHVYSRFDAAAVVCPHKADRFIQALANGSIEEIGSFLFNSLEQPASELMPELEEYKRAMRFPGVVSVLMTGSGSCLFALCENAQVADSVAQSLRELFPECFALATASKV